MSFWADFGFRENPYSTTPIPPTAEGARLLVGRDSELKKVERLITASASHPTVEGDNGVGKTSLISVAGYRLMQEFQEGGSNQLFIPLSETFQLTPNEDLEAFRRRVYFAVARSFLTHNELIQRHSLATPDVDDVNSWLNSPLLHDRAGGLSVAGTGANVGKSTVINEAAGWNESGFQSTIETWLAECFPTREAGGFIGVIDNLELLETSQKARALLEALRDSVLNRLGLRWVLCGARGIVRSSAASPRLAGVLAEPLALGPLSDDDLSLMVERRIEAYAMNKDAYVPVDGDGFRFIYDVLNRNLRDALSYAQNYALSLDSDRLPLDRVDHLAGWLAGEAVKSLEATRLPPRSWKVLEDLVKEGGSCSPSDYASFDFNSAEAFRAPVKALEDANLVTSTKADTDKRRKTISMTSRGWLVTHARAAKHETSQGAQQHLEEFD